MANITKKQFKKRFEDLKFKADSLRAELEELQSDLEEEMSCFNFIVVQIE